MATELPVTVTQWLGMASAIVLPFCNIPLIVRIQQRRCADDMSPAWAWGVWGCLALMVPSGLQSPDPVFRAFAVLNFALFTAVVVQVMRFRRRRSP